MEISGLIYLWIPIYITASCLNNCQRCRQDIDSCQRCEDGYYISDGTCYMCGNTGCLCRHQNECYGCKEGFYITYDFWRNLKCEKCMTSCRSCTNDDRCSACKPGFYGRRCEKPCSPGCLNTCDIFGRCHCKPYFTDSLCETCINRFDGENCSQKCSPNCSACTDENSCISCIIGYYGPYCQLPCLSSMCSNGECNKQSGFCSSCVTGYTGYSCNQTCSTGCLNDTCDQFSGQCTHKCKTGFHGDKCEYSCPPNCQLCTSVNYCSKCEDGFHGNTCEYSCPSNCQVCTSMSSCSQCKEGFNGSTCEHNCPDGCSRGLCNSSDYCQYGCQHGYWDRNCDRKCKDNCTACDQITGACLRCLSARYYGGECDTPCNTNCVNMSCHINGTCTRGCNGNYYGSSCETPCSEHCARFENEFACSSDTGRCMFGCAEGFTGSMCMQVIKQESDGGIMLPAAIGAGCAAFVIIAIAGAVGVFVHVRGRSPIYDTVQRVNNANVPEELTYAALQANDSVRPTDVSAHSPVCGESNAEYLNTDN